jgi:hypothetical protein
MNCTDTFFIENPQYVNPKVLFKKKNFDIYLNEFKNRVEYADDEEAIS